jgi:hypothetical protein
MALRFSLQNGGKPAGESVRLPGCDELMDPDLLSEIVIAIGGAAVFFFLMLTVIAVLAAKLYAFGAESHGSHISALDGVPSSVSLQKSRRVIANTSLENVSRPRTGHDAEVSMDLSLVGKLRGMAATTPI